MTALFTILLLLSLAGLIVGAANPSVYNKINKIKATRKQAIIFFFVLAFVFMVLIGATADVDDQNTANELDAEQQEESTEEGSDDINGVTFNATIDELPDNWNGAIDTIGSGYKLPNEIEADKDIFGDIDTEDVDATELDVGNESTIFIAWNSNSREVSEIEIAGQTTEDNITNALTASAAAMVHIASGRSISDAEDFVSNELMTEDINSLEEDDVVNNLVEEEDIAYRFTIDGAFGYGTWTASAQ